MNVCGAKKTLTSSLNGLDDILSGKEALSCSFWSQKIIPNHGKDIVMHITLLECGCKTGRGAWARLCAVEE
jgi:hypothetical protein